MTARRYSSSNALEITLFILMVGAIAAVALFVMGDYGPLQAVFVGGGIGVLAGVVLAILFRRSTPAQPDKPAGLSPRQSLGRTGPVVPARGAEGDPNTTLQSRSLAGATDAGGVGKPATAAARSPLDPAEMPVAGAGGPLAAPRAAEAAATAAGSRSGTAPMRPVAGDDHARSPEDRGARAVEAEVARAESAPNAQPRAREGRQEATRPGQTLRAAPADLARATAGGGQAAIPPQGLDHPRGGTADDLTRIRGIGSALERKLNAVGIYHFDQIATWGQGETLWADLNLEGYRSRASRDDWVGQARALLGMG